MKSTLIIKKKAYKPCTACGSRTILYLNGKYAGIWECQNPNCGVSEYTDD